MQLSVFHNALRALGIKKASTKAVKHLQSWSSVGYYQEEIALLCQEFRVIRAAKSNSSLASVYSYLENSFEVVLRKYGIIKKRLHIKVNGEERKVMGVYHTIVDILHQGD